LSLSAQDQIALAAPPGRHANFAGAFAGVARIHTPAAGSYRVSLDQAGWIDVIAEHGVISASDFTGGGCSAPHKVVQFELPAGDLTLQLSGVKNPLVRVTVTPVPAP
jgi:hypothetical protein